MSTFTDDTGREWKIPPITWGVAEDLRDDHGLDLGLAASDTTLDEFSGQIQNPMVLVPALHFLLKPGCDPREFGEALVECIDDAQLALLERVSFFFPTSRRAVLLLGVAAARNPEAFGILVGDSQEGSESTPEDSASANLS